MQTWITRQLVKIYPPSSDEQIRMCTALAFFASSITGGLVCLYAIGLIALAETLAGALWLAWGIYGLLALAIYLRTRRFIKITYVFQSAFCLVFPLIVNGCVSFQLDG